MLTKELGTQHEQVVKVKRIARSELLLILIIHLRYGSMCMRGGRAWWRLVPRAKLCRRLAARFGARDLREHMVWLESDVLGCPCSFVRFDRFLNDAFAGVSQQTYTSSISAMVKLASTPIRRPQRRRKRAQVA